MTTRRLSANYYRFQLIVIRFNITWICRKKVVFNFKSRRQKNDFIILKVLKSDVSSFRSSHPDVLREKMYLEISRNSEENTCARAASACNFIKKEARAQVFSCEICEISKNAFFTEHLRWMLLNLLIFNNSSFIEHLWLLLYFLKVIKQLFWKGV